MDQIIPLFFTVIWGPVDVQLLGEFLNLPVSPVRRPAARHLLRALAAQPGTGGDEWLSALQKINSDEALGPVVAAELDQLLSTGLLADDGTVTGAAVVGFPSPALFGCMIGGMAFAILSPEPVGVPRWINDLGQVGVGIVVAGNFDWQALAALSGDLVSILVINFATLVLSLFAGVPLLLHGVG